MARKRIITESITCDICGSETDEATTVTLGWDKDQWELDLCDKDNTAISKAFDAWIDKGRKVSRRTRRTAGSSTSASETAAIREWALAKKLTTATKGRISAEIREAYAAANK